MRAGTATSMATSRAGTLAGSVSKPSRSQGVAHRSRKRCSLSRDVIQVLHLFADAVGSPPISETDGGRNFTAWLNDLRHPALLSSWMDLFVAIGVQALSYRGTTDRLRTEVVREIIHAVVTPRQGESRSVVGTNARRQSQSSRSGNTLMSLLCDQGKYIYRAGMTVLRTIGTTVRDDLAPECDSLQAGAGHDHVEQNARAKTSLSVDMGRILRRFAEEVGAPTMSHATGGGRNFARWAGIMRSSNHTPIWMDLCLAIGAEVLFFEGTTLDLRKEIIYQIIDRVVTLQPGESHDLVAENARLQSEFSRDGDTITCVLFEQGSRLLGKLRTLSTESDAASRSEHALQNHIAESNRSNRRIIVQGVQPGLATAQPGDLPLPSFRDLHGTGMNGPQQG